MAEPPAVLIPYGRRPRRRWRWVAVVVLIGIGSAVAYRQREHWQPAARHRWEVYQLYRSQERCMAFAPPDGQIVFSDDPAAREGAGLERVVVRGRPTAMRRPADWCDFCDRLCGSDAGWADYVSRIDDGAGPSTARDRTVAPVLVHDMRLSNGDRVLGCVTVGVESGNTYLAAWYWCPGRWSAPGTWIGADCLNISRATNPNDPLTIYAARLDAVDPSAFDIPYRVGQESGLLHGRLTRVGVEFTADKGWIESERWTMDSPACRLHEMPSPAVTLPYPPELAVPVPPADLPYSKTELAFTPDGRHLAVARFQPSSDRLVIWDLETGLANGFDLRDIGVDGVPRGSGLTVFSPDGRQCASAIWMRPVGDTHLDRELIVIRDLDTATGREIGRVTRHTGVIPHAFSSDGRSLYCSTSDQVFAYDTSTWAERPLWTAGDDAAGESIRGIAVGPTRVATEYQDAFSLRPIDTHVGRTRPIQLASPVAFTPDGRQLEIHKRVPQGPFGNYGETVQFLDLDTGVALDPPPGIRCLPGLPTLSFSPDGRWAAAEPNDDLGYLLTYPSMTSAYRVSTPRVEVRVAFAFSHDSRRLAAATAGGIVIWDLP